MLGEFGAIGAAIAGFLILELGGVFEWSMEWSSASLQFW